ncbi:MAG: hypothetical protein U0Y10_23455 [Spirosomataceae bacterium]
MFDLSKIDFKRTDDEHGRRHYSFVGIQRSQSIPDRLEFWLPLGFDDFNPTNNYETTKSFFFRMYRTFKVYLSRKVEGLNEEERKTDRDGIYEFENGFSFVNQNQEQTVFYGKLNALDKILEGYDELKISSLEKKQVRSTDIDYSKIHRYLHQATYLENDVIYLDEMTIAKSVLVQSSPPILQLFSFIYTEIKKELGELDTVPDKAFELSETFKEHHLQPDSSLFDEITFAETLQVLRIQLEDIESETVYKDEDFWHFYDAIESFLYGEKTNDTEGVFWGISNFYDVWEDMCQTYMFQSYLKPQILFADINGKLATRTDLGLQPTLEVNPFKMEINIGFAPRFLKPDLVLTLGGKLKNETEVYSVRQLPYPKQNERAFNVQLLDYDNLRNENNEIIRAYNRLLTTEDNLKKVGSKFKYMLENHFLEFQNIVQTWLNSLFDNWLKNVKIIDYKYMKESDYQNYREFVVDEKGENKIKADIQKQLIYEWAIQQNIENTQTESEFWIPYYSENIDFKALKKVLDTPSEEFKKSQIKVCKINFNILQQHYVSLYAV